jgi:predicted transcriptional regulator
MEPWLTTTLERYEALVRKDLELDQQYQDISAKKKKTKTDIEKIKRYLRGELEDPAVRSDFERIGKLKKELTSKNGHPRSSGPNKTHVILDILQKHGESGLDLNEIMELLVPYNVGINRNYVGTILRKLQQNRRMVARQGKKYFLTEAGRTVKLNIYDTEE